MKAVIYARYSSDNQTEASIEGHLRECMEFAERTEIDVIGNYIDRALTAKTDSREEFEPHQALKPFFFLLWQIFA